MKDNKDLKKLERRICCVDGQVEDLAALVDQLAEDLAELIESGAGASFEQVTNYAALPAAGSHTGEYFHVLNSQGTSWLPGSLGGTYYSKGFYYSTGTDWVFVGEVPYQASQATVDAGTDNTQFVTASTLAGASKWSTKQDNITLTTSGTSGAATLAAGALNIPQYQAALTNPVTGTGANGQVTFWTGTTTQAGSNDLFWNATNQRLGINTITPSASLQVKGAGSTSATTSLLVQNSGGTELLKVIDSNSTFISNTVSINQSAPSVNAMTVQHAGAWNGTIGLSARSAIAIYAQSSLGANAGNPDGASIVAIGGALAGYKSVGLRSNRAIISAGSAVDIVDSAMLQVDSTTRGFLPPRMTNAQRAAITSPAIGLMVYCTDSVEGIYVYKSTGWTFVA